MLHNLTTSDEEKLIVSKWPSSQRQALYVSSHFCFSLKPWLLKKPGKAGRRVAKWSETQYFATLLKLKFFFDVRVRVNDYLSSEKTLVGWDIQGIILLSVIPVSIISHYKDPY